MNAAVNRQVRLKRRPSGIPQADDFEVAQAPVPEPGDGQVLVRNIYLSVDPAMRGWVSSVANYSEPVPIGGVMRSIAVGRVVTSRHPDYHAGDVVTGQFGWQHYAAMDGTAVERRITDTDQDRDEDQVVDAEHDPEHDQGREANPDGRSVSHSMVVLASASTLERLQRCDPLLDRRMARKERHPARPVSDAECAHRLRQRTGVYPAESPQGTLHRLR